MWDLQDRYLDYICIYDTWPLFIRIHITYVYTSHDPFLVLTKPKTYIFLTLTLKNLSVDNKCKCQIRGWIQRCCKMLRYMYVVTRYIVVRCYTTLWHVTLCCETLRYVVRRYTTLWDVTLCCDTLLYVVRRYSML